MCEQGILYLTVPVLDGNKIPSFLYKCTQFFFFFLKDSLTNLGSNNMLLNYSGWNPFTVQYTVLYTLCAGKLETILQFQVSCTLSYGIIVSYASWYFAKPFYPVLVRSRLSFLIPKRGSNILKHCPFQRFESSNLFHCSSHLLALFTNERNGFYTFLFIHLQYWARQFFSESWNFVIHLYNLNI